jgi:hypothetical protein
VHTDSHRRTWGNGNLRHTKSASAIWRFLFFWYRWLSSAASCTPPLVLKRPEPNQPPTLGRPSPAWPSSSTVNAAAFLQGLQSLRSRRVGSHRNQTPRANRLHPGHLAGPTRQGRDARLRQARVFEPQQILCRRGRRFCVCSLAPLPSSLLNQNPHPLKPSYKNSRTQLHDTAKAQKHAKRLRDPEKEPF